MQPSPKELIAKLGLEPHQEGGWFRQVYKSALQVQAPQGRRSAATTIYYLLEHRRASPWHVVQSDEIWHFYHGAPSELLSYDPASHKLIRPHIGPATAVVAPPAQRRDAGRRAGCGDPGRDLAGGALPGRIHAGGLYGRTRLRGRGFPLGARTAGSPGALHGPDAGPGGFSLVLRYLRLQ